MAGAEDLIAMGEIGRPHGIKGEVRVRSLTDWPERLKTIDSLFLESSENDRRWVGLEKVRFQKNLIVLKLNGIDDRNEAETLRGCILKVQESVIEDIPEGTFHIHDLIGLTVVTSTGKEIGPLTDVLKMPAHDVYAVEYMGKEVLIPAVKAFVKKIDVSDGIIVIEPIEGLLGEDEI